MLKASGIFSSIFPAEGKLVSVSRNLKCLNWAASEGETGNLSEIQEDSWMFSRPSLPPSSLHPSSAVNPDLLLPVPWISSDSSDCFLIFCRRRNSVSTLGVNLRWSLDPDQNFLLLSLSGFQRSVFKVPESIAGALSAAFHHILQRCLLLLLFVASDLRLKGGSCGCSDRHSECCCSALRIRPDPLLSSMASSLALLFLSLLGSTCALPPPRISFLLSKSAEWLLIGSDWQVAAFRRGDEEMAAFVFLSDVFLPQSWFWFCCCGSAVWVREHLIRKMTEVFIQSE